MNFFVHLSVNIFLGLLLKLLFGLDYLLIAVFIIAGIIIDIDHVLFFLFKYPKKTVTEWVVIGKRMRRY